MTNATTGRCDPHTHTTYSDGLGSPRDILAAAVARNLHVIAITDHDAVDGAVEARIIASGENSPVEVIVGSEVTTARGVHLLALFIETRLPMFRSLEETVQRIGDQGGLALAPHPLSRLTPSMGRRAIERLLERGLPLVAVETINPSPAGRCGPRVVHLNTQWSLAQFGGSDAHFPVHVGAAYTSFPGTTADDFRAALIARTTVACRQEEPLPKIPLRDYARQSGRSMILNPVQKVVRRISRFS